MHREFSYIIWPWYIHAPSSLWLHRGDNHAGRDEIVLMLHHVRRTLAWPVRFSLARRRQGHRAASGLDDVATERFARASRAVLPRARVSTDPLRKAD